MKCMPCMGAKEGLRMRVTERECAECTRFTPMYVCVCAVRTAMSSKRCLRCALKCNTEMHRKQRHPYSWIYVCIVHICHCHWIVQWVVIWNHFNPLIFAHACVTCNRACTPVVTSTLTFFPLKNWLFPFSFGCVSQFVCVFPLTMYRIL